MIKSENVKIKELLEIASVISEAKYPPQSFYNKNMKITKAMSDYIKFLKGEKGKWADGEVDDDFEDAIAALDEAIEWCDKITGVLEILETEDE